MDDDKLFELVRKNYNIANKDYIKEQVKVALKDPAMAKQETLDGLIDWIVEAGCTGMNEYYRKFVFSAVAYLLKEQEAVETIITNHIVFGTSRKCSKCHHYLFPAGRYCPLCGGLVKWNE